MHREPKPRCPRCNGPGSLGLNEIYCDAMCDRPGAQTPVLQAYTVPVRLGRAPWKYVRVRIGGALFTALNAGGVDVRDDAALAVDPTGRYVAHPEHYMHHAALPVLGIGLVVDGFN